MRLRDINIYDLHTGQTIYVKGYALGHNENKTRPCRIIWIDEESDKIGVEAQTSSNKNYHQEEKVIRVQDIES